MTQEELTELREFADGLSKPYETHGSNLLGELIVKALAEVERLREALGAIADSQGVMPAGEACECPDLAQAALNGQEVANG